MSWLEERLRSEELERNNRILVRQHAETVYDDLWEEVTGRVAEAKKAGFKITTNGSPHQRVVVWDKEVLQISLERELGIISVNGGGVRLELSLAVCADGVVCIQHGGQRISLEDAGKLILEPFLSPPTA